MRYKIGKIDPRKIYWLLKDIEVGVGTNPEFKDWAWVIVYLDEKEIIDVGSWDDDNKVKAMMALLKKGAIFPPVSLNYKNEILSGSHRTEAYRRLGWKEVPVLKPAYCIPETIGNPCIVEDEVYAPLIAKAKIKSPENHPSNNDVFCLKCDKRMDYFVSNQTDPSGHLGPCWYCPDCHIRYTQKTWLGHVIRPEK